MIVSGLINKVLVLTGGSTTSVLLALVAVVVAFMFLKSYMKPEVKNAPPCIPPSIPFIGSVIEFGQQPIDFLYGAYKKHGPIFSFYMFGRKCTYLLGAKHPNIFFNSYNEDFNAEEVYNNLTRPVFGPGVAYDIEHKKFSEQKRIGKLGLTLARFRSYVPVIEEEATLYMKRLGDSGEVDIFQALSEMVIMTASRCLLGEEVRALLYEGVADLYHDLDGGFTPAAWFLPAWLPLPSFRKRDAARIKLQKLFTGVIHKRRKSSEEHEDMLHTLMTQQYKNGDFLTDEEICGLLIAFLLAGQHTSSTTGAWMGAFISKDKELQDKLYKEQIDVCGKDFPPLDFDTLKNLELLDRTLRETLRLRPPIMQLMRLVKTPCTVDGMLLEKDSYVCVSPTVNHIIEGDWKESQKFNPDRFEDSEELASQEGKFGYIPFGAGRHRCVGEVFAYTQLKTIWSCMLRKYEFELKDGKFPDIDFTTMIHTPVKPILKYKLRKTANSAA
eukprot:Nk52_evm19s123 gene=Nk52_evmTU19s123